MSRKESGRGRANGIPSLAAPKNLEELRAVAVNVGQPASRFNVLASHRHRWTRRRHVDGYDVLVWCLFTALSAAIVAALCAAAWLAS